MNRLRIAIDWGRRGRELAIYCAIGLFLAFVQPYNATAGHPFWAGWLYWTGFILLGSCSAVGAQVLLDRTRPDLPVPARLAVLSVAAAVSVSIGIFTVDGLLNGRWMPLAYAPRIFGLVWVISAAMTAVGFMMDRTVLAPPPEPIEGAGPAETFLSRLPLKYRKADLHAISSEDHYLRVHTSLGEELILMRLADAVRELAGADGLQVHRSWWVAIPAVQDVRRAGGKTSLVLPSGKDVPVSKSYLADAKAAGLV